jgi:hypothetical protein
MKLFNEKGDLSDNGKDSFEMYLDKEIQVLLNGAENENELRIIGGLITKRVGDMVSNAIQKKRELQGKFAAMTDEEFERYLDAKYGEQYGQYWRLRSEPILSLEEHERAIIASENKIDKLQQDLFEAPSNKLDDSQKCTGYWWHDEYGNQSYIHDEFTRCPVHDLSSIFKK